MEVAGDDLLLTSSDCDLSHACIQAHDAHALFFPVLARSFLALRDQAFPSPALLALTAPAPAGALLPDALVQEDSCVLMWSLCLNFQGCLRTWMSQGVCDRQADGCEHPGYCSHSIGQVAIHGYAEKAFR